MLKKYYENILQEEQSHLLKLHRLAGKLATQQDIGTTTFLYLNITLKIKTLPALTLESPGERFLSTEEQELVQDLDDAMWDPKLQVLPSSSSCYAEVLHRFPRSSATWSPSGGN